VIDNDSHKLLSFFDLSILPCCKEKKMKDLISWFLTVHNNGQLDLEPPYQRRSAWTLKDRKYFLDTIFRNYPCPAIFLHKEMNKDTGKMTYHVVDGKQRLETILLFFKNKIAIDPGYGDTLLNGKTWKEIEMDSVLKRRFLGYELTVEYIHATDKPFINEDLSVSTGHRGSLNARN
jgi:hypothetical protein